MRRRRRRRGDGLAPAACEPASAPAASSASSTTTTAAAAAPPPPPPASIPDPNSAEFQQNWGLGAIHADVAFKAGATGAGIIVGVVDSGVQPTQADLVGAVSPQSTDVYASRDAPAGTDQHATFVAGVIASRFNGMGTIGVAYDSTILSVRADTPGTCGPPSTKDKSTCSFSGDDLATGINYAVAHGARVINLSIGGAGPLGGAFENAMQSAVAAGVVFTISAGNDSAANPSWPAEYAVDPRFAGSVVAVGATTQSGTLASYSNKAGTAAQGYMVAPGDQIYTNCDTQQCWVVSGTSFSAPHVAGALALLLQAFPNLTGTSALSILFNTADDLGAPGVDPVYGWGALDLTKAFQPVGTLAVVSASGKVISVDPLMGTRLGAAFGDAVQRTSGLITAGYDSYKRLFRINLADGYAAAPRTSMQGGLAPPPQQAQTVIQPRPGFELDFATARQQDPLPGAVWLTHATGREQPSEVNVAIRAGRFSFQAWSGQGGIPTAPGLAGATDGFVALAAPEQALRAGYDFGSLSFSAETGVGSRFDPYGLVDQKPSRYAIATAGLRRGPFALAVSAGRLIEPQGPLGSYLPQASSFGAPAETKFVSLKADWSPYPWLALSGQAGLGRTRATGELLSLNAGAVSSTWSLDARTVCRRPGCTSFEASVEQPMRLERGSFSAVLADVPTGYFDPLQYSTRSIGAAPSGRQVNLRFSLDRDLGGFGELQLQSLTIFQEDNRADMPVNLGLMGAWRVKF